MKSDDLHTTPLLTVLAGLFACLASVIAAFGWLEALNLDVTRSIVFARPGRPIETGWQPIAVGVTSITIGANVAFGFAGIYAGVEAFDLLAQPESRGRA